MRSKPQSKAWMKTPRVAAYQAPPPSRFRRFLRFFINPWVVTFALVFTLIGFLTFTYFWFEFSDRIDRRLLSGEVYTPSAGIYSAPKMLKAGERVSTLELIDYLKSAGYIEKNNKADESRSRYSVIEGKLEITFAGAENHGKSPPAQCFCIDSNGTESKKITTCGRSATRESAIGEPSGESRCRCCKGALTGYPVLGENRSLFGSFRARSSGG